MSENYDLLRVIADKDVTILEMKGKSYGSSWRKRGGVGAFMMLARKWDRVENQMEAAGYDIFEPLHKEMVDGTTDGLLDDIRDLRRYLLLVEGHVMDSLSLTAGSHDHSRFLDKHGCLECGAVGTHFSDCPVIVRAKARESGRVNEALRSALEEGEPDRGYVNQDPDPMWLDSANRGQPRQA